MKFGKLIFVMWLVAMTFLPASLYAQTNSTCAQGAQEEDKDKERVENQLDSVSFDAEESADPNEITGLPGFNANRLDSSNWVAATQRLVYTIYFENDPVHATAAAQKVQIRHRLHQKVNYASVLVGTFGFCNHTFTIEGNRSSYQQRLDMRSTMGIYVDVVAGLDVVNNEVFWTFQSIDPATGLPPLGVHDGFLPVNDSLHSGEGFVTFSVLPKTAQCVTGDVVTAEATIVFDRNAPIPTNLWHNTVDAVAPTSSLSVTPAAGGDSIHFSGTDDANGCGVNQYKLYVSVNEGAYRLYGVYLAGTTAFVATASDEEYRYLCLAEDHVGNLETKDTADANSGNAVMSVALLAYPASAGTVSGAGSVVRGNIATVTATPATGYHFVRWTANGITRSTNSSYSFTVDENITLTAYFEPNEYLLTIQQSDGINVSVRNSDRVELATNQTVCHFDTLSVSYQVEPCYQFANLTVNGNTLPSSGVIAVTGPVAIAATAALAPPQVSTLDAFICEGEEYTFGDHSYTQSGIYDDTLQSVMGCDSISQLHLVVNPATAGSDTLSACDSYTWNDVEYTESGIYTFNTTNAAGCDSVATLCLTINLSTACDIYDTAAGSYVWDNDTYTESGTYTHTYQTIAGCDSVVTLHLIITQVGIAEVDIEGLTIYPNPTQGKVSITLEGAELLQVEVLDIIGRVLQTSSSPWIDLTALGEGSYMLRITTTIGTAIKKVIKR